MKKRFYSFDLMPVHQHLKNTANSWIKKSLLILSIILGGATHSFSQFQTVFVDPSYNLSANDINEVSTGYIMCSEVNPFAASAGITTVVKTDHSGNTVWQRKFDGKYCKVKPVSSGGFIVTGTNTSAEIVVYKLDDDGVLEWSTKYSQGFGFQVADVIVTQHSSSLAYLLVGSITRTLKPSGPSSGSDILAIKIDNAGAVIWARAYGLNSSSFGNNLNDYGGSAIEIPPTGSSTNPDYLITGKTDGYNSSHSSELYVIKADGTDGHKLFDKLYIPLYPVGNPLYVDYHNYGKSISKDNSSYYAIGGTSNNITSIDVSGAVQWCKNYSGTVKINNIDKDQNNTGYGVGLRFGSGEETALLKIGFNGAVSWTKNYKGISSFVKATANYGYVVGGSISVPAESTYGYLIVETDASGQSGCYENSESISTTDVPNQIINLGGDHDDVASLITTAVGYVASPLCLKTYSRNCSTPSTLSFVSGTPVTYTVLENKNFLSSTYYIDEEIVTPGWAAPYTIKWTLIESGPTYTDVTYPIPPDQYLTDSRPYSSFGRLIMPGGSPPTLRTDKTLCVDLTQSDGCITRQCFGRNPAYGYNFLREEENNDEVSLVNVDEFRDRNSLQVTPNPASEKVFVTIPGNEQATIQIIDDKGNTVQEYLATQESNEIDISKMKSGLYIIRVSRSSGVQVKKLQVF